MFSFLVNRASPASPPQPELGGDAPSHEDAPLFEKAVRDRIQLQNIIQKLACDLANKPLVNKLRCCAAVCEYQMMEENASAHNRVELRQKARKIISVFVQNGSMFHIQDLPKDISQALLGPDLVSPHSLLHWLLRLKYFCLEQLLENQAVHQAVRDTLQFGASTSAIRAMTSGGQFATKRSRDLDLH